MNEAKQLAGLIEDIIYHFGSYSMDNECCEGVSHAEYRALRVAMRKDTCAMQDIAKSAMVTKSGATRIISRLEEKGLAQRQRDEKDGRICCVQLTDSGKSFLNRNEDKLINRMQSVLAGMDQSVREVLLISLKAFLRSTENSEQNSN